MKKIVNLLMVALLVAACVNTNNKSKKPAQAPADKPVEEETVQETAPAPTVVPVMTRIPAENSAEGAKVDENAAVQKPEAEAKPLTVDALCVKYGVYDMLAQYQQLVQNKDKKAAKKVKEQIGAIGKAVKNDASLPQDLRDNFKTYIEDKQEEIEERYK